MKPMDGSKVGGAKRDTIGRQKYAEAAARADVYGSYVPSRSLRVALLDEWRGMDNPMKIGLASLPTSIVKVPYFLKRGIGIPFHHTGEMAGG